MKHRLGIFLSVFLLSTLALFAESNCDIIERLEGRLKDDGLCVGYDDSRKAIIAIGVSSLPCKSDDVANSSLRRDSLYLDAYRQACGSLFKILKRSIASEREVTETSRGDDSLWRSSSKGIHKVNSSIAGVAVIAIDELYGDGEHQLAVAVEWNAQANSDLNLIRKGQLNIYKEDIQEIRKWIMESQELDCLGSRMYDLEDGSYIPLGIYSASIDGLMSAHREALIKDIDRRANQCFEDLFVNDLTAEMTTGSSIEKVTLNGRESLKMKDSLGRKSVGVAKNANLIKRTVIFEGVVKDEKTKSRRYVIAYGPEFRLGR